MGEVINIKDHTMSAEDFELMKTTANFDIAPCKKDVDLEDASKFTKLHVSSGQKAQLNALLQHVPQALAVNGLASAYTVSFPDGLPHVLTALNQGGYSTAIMSDGKFVGSASLYSLSAQAAVMGAFTAMSAVTGQYFLANINNELQIVNKKLDDILTFLYGEKKAELLSEISFVQYAYSNYSTIMMHEDQRVATIASLQAAKKVAMKDIEFYMNDLDATVKKKAKDFDDLCKISNMAMKIKDSIELSRQLYVVSGLLELYYSQNYEESYIGYIKDDMVSYVNKCDSRILSGLSTLQGKFREYKGTLLEKTGKKDEYISSLEKAAAPYKNGEDAPIRVSMNSVLNALNKKAEYYLDSEGNVFVKKTA